MLKPFALLSLTLCISAWSFVPPAAAATLEGEVHIWEKGALFGENNLDDRSNAVIFIAGFSEPPPAGDIPELAQHNKSFSTRVLAITQGESVAFPNLDPFHHNVWSKSKARPFDLGLFKFPESKTVSFPQPGIVSVFCNIHPQMIATILVLPNNKYDVTPPSGKYRIEGIPAGTHAVFAWVEGAAPVRKVIEFKQGAAVKADFRLQLKRIPITHLNKEGKHYESRPDYKR